MFRGYYFTKLWKMFSSMFLRLDQLNSVFNGFSSQFKTVGRSIGRQKKKKKKIQIKKIQIKMFCTHFLPMILNRSADKKVSV